MNARHLESLVEFVKFLLPQMQEIITEIENDGGYLNFSEKFSSLLSRDGLPPWSSFYEEPLKMRGLVARSLFDSEELAKIAHTVQISSAEEVQAFRLDIQRQIIDEARGLNLDEIFQSVTPGSIAETPSLDSAQQSQLEVDLYQVLYALLTQLHSFFALLTYGQNICDLVADAKAGDDDALCKVVRIDRTSLFGIRYFQDRLIRAQVGRDPKFLKKLANAIKAKPLGAKYSHKMLLFVFFILDDEGLLYKLPREQLMDVCEELGVYGHDFGVEDPASLSSLLNKYKRRTRRQNPI